MPAPRLVVHTLLLGLLLACLFVAGCQSDDEKLESLLASGQAEAQAENHKAAIIQFRKALDVDPNVADVHFALADSYTATGKTRDALWEYAETIRLDPNNWQARLKLGALQLLTSQYAEALEQGRAAVAVVPDEPTAHILLGQAQAGLGNAAEAESAFLRAVELAPDQGSTLYVLGSFYSGQGKRDRAEAILVKFTETEPTFFAYTAFGQFLATDPERDSNAEAAFRRAIEIASSDDQTQGYQNLAAFLIARERLEDATVALEEGLASSEGDPERRVAIVGLLSEVLERRGLGDQAVALLEQSPDSAATQLVLASFLQRKGDLVGAVEAAERAVAAAPNDRNARLQLAEHLVEASNQAGNPAQIAEAKAIVDAVLAEEPTDAKALYTQGRIRLANQDVPGAIESFRASIDTRPDSPEAHYMLGRSLVGSGDMRAGRAEVARALELSPTMTVARRLLVQLHAELGEDEYAIEQGRIYLKRNPDPQIRMLLSQSLARLGQTHDALVAIDLIPADKRTTEVVFAKARLLQADGQLEAARAELLSAHTAMPTHPKILRALLQTEAQTGQIEESGARIEAAIAKDPENSELVLLRGLYKLRTGDLEAAEAAFERCLELDDANLEAFGHLARLYQRTNRLDEAAGAYERAIAKQPESAQLHHALGVIRQAQGNDTAAIASYEKAVAVDPRMAMSKNNLAYLLAESGTDLQRALDLAQEAKAQRPNDPSASDTLGWVLYRRGVPAAAVGYLREAVAGLDPGTPEIGLTRYHLAMAYEANEQKQLAVEALEASLNELKERQTEQKADGQPQEQPDWAQPAAEMLGRLKG